MSGVADEGYGVDMDDCNGGMGGGFAEIREEIDASGRVVDSQVIDLSKQLDQFQSIIDRTIHVEKDESKAQKQQELLEKLRESLTINGSGGGPAMPMDSHSKFVSEIANLSSRASSSPSDQSAGAGKSEDVDDMGFLDDLLDREKAATKEQDEETRKVVAAAEARAVASARSDKVVGVANEKTRGGSDSKGGWKKGFFSNKNSKPSSSPRKGQEVAPSSSSPSTAAAAAAANVDKSGEDAKDLEICKAARTGIEEIEKESLIALEAQKSKEVLATPDIKGKSKKQPLPFKNTVMERKQAEGHQNDHSSNPRNQPPVNAKPLSIFAQQRLAMQKNAGEK